MELLGVSVMPGPQLVQAVPVCRAFREKYPRVPIVWGGYFPSLYTEAALNAKYVDFVVKGQGEDTLLELIEELRGARDFSRVRGLSFKDQFGLHVHTAERPLRSPDDFPWVPYHRLDPAKYLARTFLGSRTAVHQASIGCPFRCNFCGVVPVYDREKMESPARTAAILTHLQATYGVNAVQFYDNNFFLREDHARELADRIAPLNLRWWCEARVDIVLGYSDDTLRKLRAAGCVMIFFGVESGNDQALRDMKKQLTVAADRGSGAAHARVRHRARVLDDLRQSRRCGARPGRQHRLRAPGQESQSGGGDRRADVCAHAAAQRHRGAVWRWRSPRRPTSGLPTAGIAYLIRTDPQLPWLPPHVARRIHDFETVMNSRWPTTQDMRLPGWGRTLLKSLSSWRYAARGLRFSRRIAPGAKAGAPAAAAAGEPLMTAIPVDAAREGYRLWAATWDATPSPIVAVEQRALLPWLARAASAPRHRCGLRHRTVDGAPWMRSAWMPRRRCSRRAAAKPGLRGRLAVADATALPMASGVADLVLCALTLGHLADPAPALREFARVLAPGGTLLLTDFHPGGGARLAADVPPRGPGLRVGESRAHAGATARPPLRSDMADCVEAPIGEQERALFDAAGTAGTLRGGMRHARGAGDALDTQMTADLDLAGHVVMPGLINAHDHLEFNLFPRLGRGPYANAGSGRATFTIPTAARSASICACPNGCGSGGAR